jgi:hypothetical protein
MLISDSKSHFPDRIAVARRITEPEPVTGLSEIHQQWNKIRAGLPRWMHRDLDNFGRIPTLCERFLVTVQRRMALDSELGDPMAMLETCYCALFPRMLLFCKLKTDDSSMAEKFDVFGAIRFEFFGTGRMYFKRLADSKNAKMGMPDTENTLSFRIFGHDRVEYEIQLTCTNSLSDTWAVTIQQWTQQLIKTLTRFAADEFQFLEPHTCTVSIADRWNID